MGFLDLVEGTAISERHPARAVTLLTRALSRLDRWGGDTEQTAALLMRGRSLLALGERDGGRADLRRGIEAHERLRKHVSAITDPARSFAAAEPAFDALTASLLKDGRAAEALANSDRGRQPVRDWPQANPPYPPITPGWECYYLDQMDDQLVAWWATAKRLELGQFIGVAAPARHRVGDLVSRVWKRPLPSSLRRRTARSCGGLRCSRSCRRCGGRCARCSALEWHSPSPRRALDRSARGDHRPESRGSAAKRATLVGIAYGVDRGRCPVGRSRS